VKITTEELERCEVLLTLEVEPKQEEKMLQKAAKRIAREVKIPGFRPGKAPYNVVVRRFGLEAIQQEAMEQSADKIIMDALEEADVQPYARIDLDSIDWNPLTIKVKVPTQPKVELADYRDIRLDVEPVEVTEEDVEESLKNLQEQTATWTPVERPSQIGDLISMSAVEKDGDEVLAKRDSVEHELDPPEEHEGHNHPDFTAPLLGLSDGDEKTYTLTYPEEFDDERYAGKDITFEVEILSVKEKEVDLIDDEFAKAISDFDTLEELKADTEERLRGYRERQRDTELGNKVLEQIIEGAEIIWPLAFEEENVDLEIARYERQMQNYGLALDNFLQMQNKTREEFKEETRTEVVNRLKRGLVLGKVAETEKLEISESEILEHAKWLADISGRGDQFWRDILASEDQQHNIANELLADKTIKWLAAIAKGEDPQPETEAETDDVVSEASEDESSSESTAEDSDEPADEAEESQPEASVEQDESEDESVEEPAETKA